MALSITLMNEAIRVSHKMISDTYYIEQMECGAFHITSENGYSTYGTNGFAKIEQAIKQAKKLISMYFIDRGEENPNGFLKSLK